MSESPNLLGNVERFTGFADVYDAYRPQPPKVLVEILSQMAEVARPELVVDLGCGTGLSTQIWTERAAQVVGVDPSADMLRQARARTEGASNIRFVQAFSSDTSLEDGRADIVTVSQALHWMDPDPTFREVTRILRPGGVFAAYDCDWPPTITWPAEKAYSDFSRHAGQLARSTGLEDRISRWRKSEHLERIRASDRFRYVKEIAVHHREMGDANRLVGLALSQGSIAGLLREGVSEEALGLEAFRAAARAAMGEGPMPWYWTYRVRLGVK